MLRLLLGIVLGVILADVIIAACEFAGAQIWPAAANVASDDPSIARMNIAALPAGALLLVLFGWVAGAAAGARLALRIAQRRLAARAVTVIVLAFSIVAMMMYPGHPWWMWAGALVLVPLAGWRASRK